MEAELIPGLPDCLALECLLRLPFHAIPDARAVCKRWKHELASPSFYRIRRTAGFAHRLVPLLLRGKLPLTVGKLHLALYEPATGVCTMRQLAPNRPNDKMGSSNAAVVGQELVVIGGWDMLENRRTGEVHIYDLLSGAWRPGAPNPAPERSFYRCSLEGEKIFLVGGKDVEGKKLRSALVYDVAANTWLQALDLEQDTCQDTCQGTSIDGNFCVKYWRNREEYNSAIQRCKELLLLDDEHTLSLFTTNEEKEIFMCVPKDKSKEKWEVEVILRENVLDILRRRLGLLPNDFGMYLESYQICSL